MLKSHPLNSQGFTLIELLVTAAIVASVSISVSEIFIATGATNSMARNLALASEIAQQKMESDRNAGFTAILASEDFTSTLPAYLGSPRSATATFNDLSPVDTGLKLLKVAISYTDKGRVKNVQVSTLVAQKGIDR